MANVKNGGVIAAAQNAVQQQKQEKPMVALVNKMMPEIKKALPSVLTPERFTRMVLSAISSTPKLAECDPKTFLGAMMSAAQLGVEPNSALGEAWLIPYRNKGRMECQFQLGYKGLIDLAYRSGDIISISAHTVHENDEFSYELGLDEKLVHKPALRDRGEAVCYYATFKTRLGGFGFAVMSVDDIKAHMNRYSKAAASGFSPWSTNFDEMAKKTVLKKCLKYAPLKSDFVKAVNSDETIKSELSDSMIDVQPEEINVTEEGTVVDTTTGEVIDKAQAEEDAILFGDK